MNANKIEINENGVGYIAITTINVKPTCLEFTDIPAAGSAPPGITATTTIDGKDFSITKYIRK